MSYDLRSRKPILKFLTLAAVMTAFSSPASASKEDPSVTTLEITSSKNAELLPRLAQFPNLEKLTISHPDKQKEITKRFPKIKFEFRNEYDCP